MYQFSDEIFHLLSRDVMKIVEHAHHVDTVRKVPAPPSSYDYYHDCQVNPDVFYNFQCRDKHVKIVIDQFYKCYTLYCEHFTPKSLLPLYTIKSDIDYKNHCYGYFDSLAKVLPVFKEVCSAILVLECEQDFEFRQLEIF